MAKKSKKPAARNVEAITRDNQLNSPLLRLPAELRNRIYHFTFDTNEVVLEPPGYMNPPDYYHPLATLYPLGLAQSCIQCRCEALPYFWETTVFQLGYGGYIDGLFQFASEAVTDQIQIIRVPSQAVHNEIPGQRYTLDDVLKLMRQDRYQERNTALRRVLMWWPTKDTSIPEGLRRTFGKDIEICFYTD